MRRIKLVALLFAVVVLMVIGWGVAPHWFRSGLALYARDYVRESAFMHPIQRYERWRVSHAGYNYDDILSECGRAGEGRISLVEAVTIRDAEYVVDEPQVRVKGDKIVADVPTEITTRGNVVIPTQHHCEYDVLTGSVIRSETLRVSR